MKIQENLIINGLEKEKDEYICYKAMYRDQLSDLMYDILYTN